MITLTPLNSHFAERPEIRVQADPLPPNAIGRRVRWLLGGCGLLVSLASVWLASTGNIADHALGAGLTAASAIALWTPALTTAWPRPAETLMAALVVGLLALAADPTLPPWSIPHSLTEVGRLTNFAAGSFTAIYLLMFVAMLWGRGRPLSLAASSGLLAVPFLFNVLLALASPTLMTWLGEHVAFDPTYAPWFGRAVTLWLFNLMVVVGVAWVIDQRGTRSWRIQGTLLLATVSASLTPVVADFGSSPLIAEWSPALRLPTVALTAALAQAGLWAEVFLVTGVLLDGLRGRRPTPQSCVRNWRNGLVRGAVFGALYMLLIHLAVAGAHWSVLARTLQGNPLLGGALLGALLFPLARTLMESFDGCDPFFARLKRAYSDPTNALRGLCIGAALMLAVNTGLAGWSEGRRFVVGFAIGALGYGGADLLRDLYAVVRRRRQRLQGIRLYAFGLLLGGVVGGALAWYFDVAQLTVVTNKLNQYAQVSALAAGGPTQPYVVYPLFSKWGAIDLGDVAGGVSLFWSESMAGVINWAIAAPLFGVNLVLLTALIQRSFAPLRELFSRAGLVGVFAQTIRVLRWGPWMAPVIFTFLRLSPEPSWYNQDGLVRTLVAITQSIGLSPESFHLWSLQCFLGLLAYDWLRILIWFDHMGLRVATLVNLSFVGADVLDEKAARMLGHSARTRVIPEGIRRFFTWAPLLIPFYLPRGADWDYVWNGAEMLAADPGAPLLPAVWALIWGYGIFGLVVVGLATGTLARRRYLGLRTPPRTEPAFAYRLSNGQYTLELNPDGGGYSHVDSSLRPGSEIDLTRRPDDVLQLRGKWFWLREMVDGVPQDEPWSLTALPSGHPDVHYHASQPRPTLVRFVAERGDLRIEVGVRVAAEQNLEVWSLRLHNASARPRSFEITSYREFAMAATDSYRRAPSFAAMHVGTCFVPALAALLAHNRQLHNRHDRSSPEVAFHAVKTDDDRVRLLGYEDSRLDFIGGGTLRHASVFAGRPLRDPDDRGHLYTFDPIASLRAHVQVPAQGIGEVLFVDGYAKDAVSAQRLIRQAFQRYPPRADILESCFARNRVLRQFDPPATNASVFSADGFEVKAPTAAARPWTHLLANELGQGALVGADGSVFSFNGNAQQNALTPFAVEALPSQTPGQLLGVLDLDSGERFNATLIPWRRVETTRDAVFGLGYVCFRAQQAGLELEETVVLPPDAPLLLRQLRVRNVGATTRRLRAIAFAEMVLAETPVDSRGHLEVREDAGTGALLFQNANNDFRKGWAFVATNFADPVRETLRARFLGSARELGEAHFLAHGSGDARQRDDGRRCAAFASTLELAPGEEHCLNLVIGQADEPVSAVNWARSFQATDVRQVLRTTRAWWLRQLGSVQLETDHPEFDRLVNVWLPYQVLTARLWGRCGAQQRSGAFGFRDQLQDVLPLIWSQPQRARRQILLHAAQQLREGDVLMWWHPSWEGRTGFAGRGAASDPHLWLPYVVARYVRATGERAILGEILPFLEGRELPRGQGGILFAPRASRDVGSLYEHCRRALDHTLARLSPRGLPLIGSGDWNDGLSALGMRGKGESVWLGFFLHGVLRDFAALAAVQADTSSQRRYEDAAARLRQALELTWRGDGYVRATSDSGDELRFPNCLMAAWPTLSRAVPEDRAKRALESALQALEREQRVLLLTPSFHEHSTPYPGRIAEYPPGVRENGGQYSHGASWLVDAWLQLAQQAAGRGDGAEAQRCHGRAWEIWWKISPLSKTDPAYGLPPHQQSADVYDGPGYAGRGGWAWYTGAAARMLDAAYGLLGLNLQDGKLQVNGSPAHSSGPLLRRLRYQGRDINLSAINLHTDA